VTARAPEHWVDQDPQAVRAPDAPWLEALLALGEVFFATEDGPPPRDRLHWMCCEVEDFFARASVQSRSVFQLSLTSLRVMVPVMAGRAKPLHRLSLADRVRGLDRFERSPLGAALFAVKAILCIIYYEHPDAAEAIGFDGAPLIP